MARHGRRRRSYQPDGEEAVKEMKFDRVKIAKLTGHYRGCRCCWCKLGETCQLWEHTAKTFDETTNILRGMWPFSCLTNPPEDKP